MRRILALAAVLLVALPALAGPEHPMRTPSGWFDFDNCDFCRHLIADPGLLPHTTWENHKIADGMMNIMTVTPEYAESMATCSAAMEKLGNGMISGDIKPEDVSMCGSCQEFTQLIMAGVEMETVEGDAAEVTLFTSDDAALVDRLHRMVDRNNEEMALMMAGSH